MIEGNQSSVAAAHRDAGNSKEPGAAAPSPTPGSKNVVDSPARNVHDVANTSSTYRHRDPEHRRRYMRDYMRRKRAAERDNK